MTTARKAAPRRLKTLDEAMDGITVEIVKPSRAPKRAITHNPRGTNPTGDATKCRGRWSKCGGKNPAKSASWHLCDNGPKSCTALYKAMKKAAATPKAAKAKPSAKAKAKASAGGLHIVPPPTPAKVAHPRVTATVRAAFVAPTVEKVAAAR